jgi:hypothetical protein
LPPVAALVSAAMDATERDTTEDWRLPAQASPPLFGELVGRVDEALAIARSSESAVLSLGAAALDAAEQARRAAEAAERASATLLEERQRALREERRRAQREERQRLPWVTDAASADSTMRRFSERADRVTARLLALERLPA